MRKKRCWEIMDGARWLSHGIRGTRACGGRK